MNMDIRNQQDKGYSKLRIPLNKNEFNFLENRLTDEFDPEIVRSMSMELGQGSHVGDNEQLSRKAKDALTILERDFNMIVDPRSEANNNVIFNKAMDVYNKFTSSISPKLKGSDYFAEFTRLIFRNVLTNPTMFPDVMTHLIATKQLQGDFTYIHSMDVAKWAVFIGSSINYINKNKGIDRRYNLNEVVLAALLHDVGKLDPRLSHLVYFPGKFNDEQSEEFKLHTNYGFEILNNYDSFAGNKVTYASLHHHEKVGGTGNHGLEEYDIDPVSAIIKVADVFEALHSDRFYRDNPIPLEKISEKLIKEVYERPSQFFNEYENVNGRVTQINQEKSNIFTPALIMLNITEAS